MATTPPPFSIERVDTIMTPQPGLAFEAEGVLNPATARARDGHLYMFARLVARGNYSRIGIERVIFDEDDDPVSVDRLGTVLEPVADFEFNEGGGGCEDPRVTYMPILGRWLMTYTAYGPAGPRIALAESSDLFTWRRLGPARFEPYDEKTDFDNINNKDALLFPEPIPDPLGRPSIGLIHRPLFPETAPLRLLDILTPRRVNLPKESLWISYLPLTGAPGEPIHPHFTMHHRLAAPAARWERIKVGGGTPPVMTRFGWLVVYHGVSGDPGGGGRPRRLVYAAGALILDRDDPRRILYRSPEPILEPDTQHERLGIVNNVVFPTGIDQRSDVHRPDRFDVYYGMADTRIGVGRMWLPESLPPHSARVEAEDLRV